MLFRHPLRIARRRRTWRGQGFDVNELIPRVPRLLRSRSVRAQDQCFTAAAVVLVQFRQPHAVCYIRQFASAVIAEELIDNVRTAAVLDMLSATERVAFTHDEGTRAAYEGIVRGSRPRSQVVVDSGLYIRRALADLRLRQCRVREPSGNVVG